MHGTIVNKCIIEALPRSSILIKILTSNVL